MTLQQILYFREIAYTQNFTQAAQNLFVAQSGLSHSIQCLEKELGVPLFLRRSGKKVILTSYGQAFLPYAEQMLSDLDTGRKVIDQMRNPNSGVVSVTYSYVNCFYLIQKLFQKFYEENRYDDIMVRFEINQGRSLIEHAVASGEQNLAFSCTPSFEGVTSVPVAKQELFLMLPANHPLAGAPAVSLQDIKNYPLVGLYQNWNLSNWINGMFEQEGLHPNILEYFHDWATQMNYVALGIGLAISPRIPVNSDLIVSVPLDHPGRFRNIYLHWASNQKLPAPAEFVRQYCLDYFREPAVF